MRGLLLAAGLVLAAEAAWAHDAPTGWTYPFECCAGYDCRMVQLPQRVRETSRGYVVPSGELIVYDDVRIKKSPDGEFHWCTVAGAEDAMTICLFVPPRDF